MNTHRGTKGRASYVIRFEDWESVGEKKWFFGFFFSFSSSYHLALALD